MANVLVTGGAGYVGSVCASELIRQNHNVVIVDDLSTGHRESVPAQAEFHQLDIGDASGLESLVQQHSFDAVFHFAARALIPESVTDPAVFFRINVASSLTLLDVVRRAGIRKFIFSSTAAVYGNPVRVPIAEDHPKRPVNSYGETKLCFERALEWYARAYGITAVAFRYFNASGGTSEHGERHDPETHIIPLLLDVAAGERPHFTIFGDDYDTRDGTCIRDYVHVSDIAHAHILALNLKEPGFRAYNIGTGQGYSVRQVHKVAEQVAYAEIPLQIGERRMGDPAVLQAAPDRLILELGWWPQHSTLEKIVASAWAWKNRAAAQKAA